MIQELDLETDRELDLEPTPDEPKQDDAEVSSTLPSIVRIYLNDIGRIKLLSDETKTALARQIYWAEAIKSYRAEILEKTGSLPSNRKTAAHLNRTERDRIKQARDSMPFIAREIDVIVGEGEKASKRLVAANLRFVVSIAKNYLNRGVAFLDLIQEGSIGLIRGAAKFDPEKGYKFSTYVSWWIRQAITRSINDSSRTIRQSIPYSDLMTKIEKTRRELQQLLNRAPLENELIDTLVDSGTVRDRKHYLTLIGLQRRVISIDRSNSGDDENEFGNMADRIADESTHSTIVDERLRQDIETVLGTLNPHQNWVLRLRQGLNQANLCLTTTEIAAMLNDDPERLAIALDIEIADLMEISPRTRQRITSLETGGMRAIRRYQSFLQVHR